MQAIPVPARVYRENRHIQAELCVENFVLVRTAEAFFKSTDSFYGITSDQDVNEPWVFVIGADGRITARFDNVVTRSELEPLLQKLPPRKP